jgi:hypothetical protein
LPCSFDDLNEHDAERALGDLLYCLHDLADYLADNVSFGELFHTKREEVEKAFGGLNDLAGVKREFRYFFPVDDAVEMATRSEADQATVLESVSADEKRVICGEACSEVIAVQIHWRYTDSQIAATMEKLLRGLRPRNKEYKPRQPKKGSRRDSSQSARLPVSDALGVTLSKKPVGGCQGITCGLSVRRFNQISAIRHCLF